MDKTFIAKSNALIDQLSSKHLAPLDLLSHFDLPEKLVELVLNGVPHVLDYHSTALFSELRQRLIEAKTEHLRVVVFGGGTGLSNIIGGDCRQRGWGNCPFDGLKQVFPMTTAVVCVTDDGGSTGELLKDLPVIAVGDIRHVLLSSIQLERLQQRYDLTIPEATSLARELSSLFNYRYEICPDSVEELLLQCGVNLAIFPDAIRTYIQRGLRFCFSHELCRQTLKRSHCLGNLLVISALCRPLPDGLLAAEPYRVAGEYGDHLYLGLRECAAVMGAADQAVLPATVTPAQLRFLYSDGVQVTGERKSSEARRGFPVDRVYVDFSGRPYVPETLLQLIRAADILIMAPGSLYSSIIPVMQVPGVAAAVRENSRALKLLIANLWVQDGETDKSNLDPERKFHVSDMIRAYDRNLPGGVQGLFDQVLCLSLQDIPGSVIQNYAVEGKSPIYLDRDVLETLGYKAVECGFYSKAALYERLVIQHDPHVVAQTVKTIYLASKMSRDKPGVSAYAPLGSGGATVSGAYDICMPSLKYKRLRERLYEMKVTSSPSEDQPVDENRVRDNLVDIIWYHRDIPISHFDTIKGIVCVREDRWRRDQRWDNVFSFYEPSDGQVYIRRDRLEDQKKLEVAFLIAVGQSLLGDYASEKRIEPLTFQGVELGRVYHLLLRPREERTSYFSDQDLRLFLALARMKELDPCHFTRVANGQEGFTPPGLLMGLMYAWYLDNRLASHIEYKMSIMRIEQTDLIPEQIKMKDRRVQLILFFRTAVFGHNFISSDNKEK